jgi:hypothetical protein
VPGVPVVEVDVDVDARDLAACRPSSVVKLAAAAAAFSGFGSLMLALQSLLMLGRSLATLASAALTLEALLGVLLLIMAIVLLRLRFWATIVAAPASFSAALLILAWNLFALSRGLFSIMGFAVPASCIVAGLLSLSALGAARRADAARERLRDRGINVGL